MASLLAVLATLCAAALVGHASDEISPEPPKVVLDTACDNVTEVCNITDRTTALVFSCNPVDPARDIVYWLLGVYQVVDLAEFVGGSVSFQSEPGFNNDTVDNTYSSLVMTIDGTDNLFTVFETTKFTIQCISVRYNVNVNRGPLITLDENPSPPTRPTATPSPSFALSPTSTPTITPDVVDPDDPDNNRLTLGLVIGLCFLGGFVVGVILSLLLCCFLWPRNSSDM